MNSAKPFNLSFLYLHLFVYCTKRNKSFFTITYFNFDDTKEKEDEFWVILVSVLLLGFNYSSLVASEAEGQS